MASVVGVAKYILEQQGPMTAMKLQKLCYYAQAWSLVWDERLLFDEHLEAWANGPVSPLLYEVHRGKFSVSAPDIPGDSAELDPIACETIAAVLRYYGSKPSAWLSELTHKEAPWRDARQGLDPGERGSNEITHADMFEYYDGL